MVAGSGGSDRAGDFFGVGTAQAQSTNTTAENTTANGTATTSPANTTNASGGSVTLENQSTPTGRNVTVANVTLPDGGFVGIHGDGYTLGQTELSLTTVSRYLEPGTYENLTIPVEAGVPGGYGNISQFNGTQNITARLYTDSNSNQRFDYLLSGDDSPYRSDGDSVTDTGEIVIEGTRGSPSWTVPRASVEFDEQTANGRTVTVQQAELPSGGFLVIHDSSYLPPENATFGSTIGVSEYIPANESVSNVTIRLFNVPGRSVNQTTLANDTTLVVRASRDTNGDRSYDYVRSDGIEDQAYTNGSEVVVDRADVTINDSANVTRPVSSQETGTGQGVNVSVGPNTGFVGQIAQSLDGPLVELFVGSMFVLFVVVFVRRVRR